MDEVNTPFGVMNVAGPVRSNGSVIFDSIIALLSTAIIFKLLEISGTTGLVVGATFVSIYIIFAYRGVFPSLGRWALGLHRFRYSQIDEYEGEGTLVVYEKLDPKIYSARAIICTLILVCLYFLAKYIVTSS